MSDGQASHHLSLLDAVRAIDLELVRGRAEHEAENAPRAHQENQTHYTSPHTPARTRQRRDQPVAEGQHRGTLAAEEIVVVLEEDHVGRRADQRGNASNGGGEAARHSHTSLVRNTQEDRLREAGHLLLSEAHLQRLHQRTTRIHHHHSSSYASRLSTTPTRVAHEDGQEGGYQHDAEQHGAWLLEETHDRQRDSHVQVPLLHRQRHQEAGEEQEDHYV